MLIWNLSDCRKKQLNGKGLSDDTANLLQQVWHGKDLSLLKSRRAAHFVPYSTTESQQIGDLIYFNEKIFKK